MSSRYSVEKKIYNPVLGDNVKDFLNRESIDEIVQSGTGIIYSGMEFRPDKVAEYYLGRSDYAWAISALNNFTNGIQDYYAGRTVKLPDTNTIW